MKIDQATNVLKILRVALDLIERDKEKEVQNSKDCCIYQNDRPCNKECIYNIFRDNGNECLHDMIHDATTSMTEE